jgi:hypothetical protein
VRISTILIVVPAVIGATIVAVANRQSVTFSLDPFSTSFPSVSFTMPLYWLVFLSILFGVLLGGATMALRRRRRPRAPELVPIADDALATTPREERPAA